MTVSDLYYSGFQLDLIKFFKIKFFKVNSKEWEWFMIFYFMFITILFPMVLCKYLYSVFMFSPIFTLITLWSLTKLGGQPLEHLQYVLFKWPFGHLYRGEAFQMRAWRSSWWMLCIYTSRLVFGISTIYQIYNLGLPVKIFIEYIK